MSRALLAGSLLAGLLAACGGRQAPPGELVGVYLLDREALALQLLRERDEAIDPQKPPTAAQRRIWREEAQRTAAEADLRLDLMAQGVFVVRYRFGAEEGRRRGTWRREGARVRLTTTHTPAGALSEPSEIAAEVAEGNELRFPRGSGVPHPFVLRRR